MSTAEQEGRGVKERGGEARFAFMFVVFFVGLPASPSPSICGWQTTTLHTPTSLPPAPIHPLSLGGKGMGQCQSTSLANIRKASHTTCCLNSCAVSLSLFLLWVDIKI